MNTAKEIEYSFIEHFLTWLACRVVKLHAGTIRVIPGGSERVRNHIAGEKKALQQMITGVEKYRMGDFIFVPKDLDEKGFKEMRLDTEQKMSEGYAEAGATRKRAQPVSAATTRKP